MMIHAPGATDNGITVEDMTEFVDLFPTLVELAGFAPLKRCPEISKNVSVCTEGLSMTPFLNRSSPQRWKQRVFSQYPRHGIKEMNGYSMNYMGYTMRTPRYRYTEWVQFSGAPRYEIKWNKKAGVELYDHDNDPEENVNLSQDKAYKLIAQKLSQQLHSGWRNALPT